MGSDRSHDVTLNEPHPLLPLFIISFFPVPPSIRGSDEASPLTVIEGSLITLVCESSGIPPPSLTWKKDGKTFHVVNVIPPYLLIII